MKNIMILCGGVSGEHEVSLQSAVSIIKYIPRDLYRAIPVGITPSGKWVTGEPLVENEDDPSNIRLASNLQDVRLENGFLEGRKIDAVFPIIHGTYGEDGCLQGFLKIHGLPFVGSGVLGSAIGMDKDIMKKLAAASGIDCAAHRVFYSWGNAYPSYEDLAAEFGETLFVKPCNLGSSIGISKCGNKESFDRAVKLAFKYDHKILIEEYVEGREIEVSVLGNENPEASLPGEIIPGGDFYSYAGKYIDSDQTELKIPAELGPAVVEELREVSEKCFRILELSGLARVDFFVGKDNRVVFNEVNTLPGFTNISMYPKLWEATGVSYPQLIDRLIQLAIEKFGKETFLTRTFE